MTEQKLMEHYEEMKTIYGEALPNTEHNPILFAFYVKIYKYYHREIYERIQSS